MSGSSRWRTAADRLGSRWCCSWQVAFGMVVLGLLVTTGWGASSRGGLSLGEYLVIELLADAAGGALLLLASVTVMRHRRERTVPVAVVAGVWVAIGLVRGLVLSRFYLEDAAQVLSAALSLAAWALLIIFLAATFSEERDRAARLQIANAELRVIRQSMQQLLDDERARLISAVRDAVSPEIARLRSLVAHLDRPGSAAEITALADTVADYSTGVVRKASHDLRGEESAPHLPSLERDATVRPPGVLVSYARASQPVAIPMGLILFKAISVWISQDDAEVLVGLTGFVVVTIVALACRAVLDRLMRRPSWPEVIASTAMIVAMSAALAGIFPWARGGVSGPGHVPPAMTFAFVLAVLVAARLVAGLEQREARQTEALSLVNADLERATQELRDEMHVVRDQLAGILHGPVQGRLAAASMALRLYVSAREAGDEADLATTMRTTTTLLDRAQNDIARIGRPGQSRVESLDEGVERLARMWNGLLEIEFSHEDRWARPPEFTAGCVDMIAELVTNASRHGDARRIRVVYAGLDAEGVVIEAVDDGGGPAPRITEGQGLGGVQRWNGTWVLTPADSGGTRATVMLRHESLGTVISPAVSVQPRADLQGPR